MPFLKLEKGEIMNYNVHITQKAENDLKEALNYIEHTLLNKSAADNLLDKADEQINTLSFMPNKHKLVDDPILNMWGIRFIKINNYLAFFIIDENLKTVYIVRILYQKRNWISILKTEPFSLT